MGARADAVLRALARAVDQNIMINDQVRGRIDVSLKAVPWDQAFLGILLTHGLTYLWEGDIIRVITLEDKNRELEQLETSQRIKAKERELRLAEPLMTQIVEIEYADADPGIGGGVGGDVVAPGARGIAAVALDDLEGNILVTRID